MLTKDALRPTTQRVVRGIPTLARGNEVYLFLISFFLNLMAVTLARGNEIKMVGKRVTLRPIPVKNKAIVGWVTCVILPTNFPLKI